MTYLATFIQHCTGDSSQSNQVINRNKKHPDWKKRKKTVFTDGTMLYLENPNESTKKQLELINEFNKFAKYNMQKCKDKNI